MYICTRKAKYIKTLIWREKIVDFESKNGNHCAPLGGHDVRFKRAF